MNDLESNGYKLINDIISQQQCLSIREILNSHFSSKYCIRDVLIKCPELIQVLKNSNLKNLPKYTNIVRSILFQKPRENNWLVPWHQDLLIQVNKKIDSPNFGPWSIKENILHVKPAREVMQNIWSFRIHLTDCFDLDGPLKVLPKTHLSGYYDAEKLRRLNYADAKTITCKAGDVLIFHPLLVHSSNKVLSQSARTVLHLECTDQILPFDLNWAHTISTSIK